MAKQAEKCVQAVVAVRAWEQPTHRGQLLDVLVRGPQRRQADLLGELSELGVRQQRNVSQELVTRVPETNKHRGSLALEDR